MTKVTQMFPSNYLKADDLQVEGDDYIERDLTIASCTKVTMPGDGSEKWVLKFHNESKGLVLNVTNTKKLGRLLGDESEKWIGKRVRLFVEYVTYKTDEVPAIRIKAAQTADEPKLLDIPA